MPAHQTPRHPARCPGATPQAKAAAPPALAGGHTAATRCPARRSACRAVTAVRERRNGSGARGMLHRGSPKACFTARTRGAGDAEWARRSRRAAYLNSGLPPDAKSTRGGGPARAAAFGLAEAKLVDVSAARTEPSAVDSLADESLADEGLDTGFAFQSGSSFSPNHASYDGHARDGHVAVARWGCPRSVTPQRPDGWGHGVRIARLRHQVLIVLYRKGR